MQAISFFNKVLIGRKVAVNSALPAALVKTILENQHFLKSNLVWLITAAP